MHRATTIAITILIATGCTGAVRPDPSPPPAPSQTSTVATVPDVLTYRGDTARTGRMPGPGPIGDPTVLWTFEADGAIGSSPTIIGGNVLIVSENGVVHAVALATGEERWRSPLGADAGAATPQIVDEVAIVGDMDGVLHGIDATTGDARWTAELDGSISGAVAATAKSVVAATNDGNAYGIDPATGEIAWRTTLPGGVSRSVAANADMAFVSAAGHVVALRATDGTIVWDARVADSGEGGTPTVADGLVYAATGFDPDDPAATGVSVIDATSGELRWRHVSASQEVVFTPAVVDGRAFMVSGDATVVAVESSTGKLLWSHTTDGPNDALPSVAQETVYVATNGGSVQALDVATGEMRWQAPIEGVPYAPVITGGFVLVGTNRGVLYAIGNHTP